jgi:hypothetical protein
MRNTRRSEKASESRGRSWICCGMHREVTKGFQIRHDLICFKRLVLAAELDCERTQPMPAGRRLPATGILVRMATHWT